jgi:hypothetical protein
MEELTTVVVLMQPPPAAVAVFLACDPYAELLARHAGLAGLAAPSSSSPIQVRCMLPARWMVRFTHPYLVDARSCLTKDLSERSVLCMA